MPKKSFSEPRWLKAPAKHDYPAAESYLSLIFTTAEAAAFVAALKKAKTVNYRAKDIFRASQLSLLGVSNWHVRKDQKCIRKGTALSPLLLVRANPKLLIADGYHRLCAVYTFNEDALIPCRIA